MARRSLADAPKDRMKRLATATEGPGRMVNTRLPPELLKRIKLACVHEEWTLQRFFKEAAEEKLKALGH